MGWMPGKEVFREEFKEEMCHPEAGKSGRQDSIEISKQKEV
jgi:hypothetical protein